MIGFGVAGAVVLAASLLTVFARRVLHAALYLVVAFLGTAVLFFSLGAQLAGVLQILIYAGAIMVMLLMVIMLLGTQQEAHAWRRPSVWLGPVLLCLVLLVALVVMVVSGLAPTAENQAPQIKDVAISLFGRFVPGVELASMILLVALVGVCHLTRRDPSERDNA
jgi:NADH-quinone oxidoreductase subunit J